MASSLEELLWEEGFKGRRSAGRPRGSPSLETTSRPLHSPRRSVSQQGMKMRTERTRSDISRYKLEVAESGSNRVRQTRPRDDFVRSERLGEGSSMRESSTDGNNESGPSEFYKRKGIFVEGKKSSGTSEIVEVGQDEDVLNGKFKDIYSNEVYRSDSRRSSVSDRKEVEGYIDGSPKDIMLEKRRSHDNNLSFLGRSSSKNIDQANANDYRIPSDRRKNDAWDIKSFGSKKSEKSESSKSGASEPALDQVAIQAVISILCGYIKPFLHDENFRNSLRVGIFSSLNIHKIDEDYLSDNKVICNLEQAIETVECVAAKGEGTRNLKKASLQLSVITGLSSNDMKDAFTEGIPNFKLSACAHVYLSVIYKLQKKEKLSARHILQVFCVWPFQARNLLLPELWEILFFPHLSHLKKWYTDEADALGQVLTKLRKLRFLKKLYNDVLDYGTFQFASYYRDWLTEDTEGPSLPLIHIPTISVRGVKQKGSSSTSSELISSPAGPFSPQPMVSRRLYEAVFNNGKHGADENEQQKVNCSPDNCIRSSEKSYFEERQIFTYATEKIKYSHQDMKITSSGNKGGNSLQQVGQSMIAKDFLQEEGSFENEVINVPRWDESSVNNLNSQAPCKKENGSFENEVINVPRWDESSGNNQDSQAPCMKENECILRSLAISVFKMQNLPAEALGDSECLYKESFTEIEPEDFICPLTGRLLSDPITLETGQTFERAAITEWFQSGSNTCPDGEIQAREEAWLRDVGISLLGSGKISFVDMISKCLCSRFPDLVRACLTTVAWLSLILASVPDAGFHLSAFLALISQLKEKLESSELLEHRVLASVSSRNFSKFPECGVLLMAIADEICEPLCELAKTTWTAKE